MVLFYDNFYFYLAPLNEDVIKFFLAQTLNAIEYLSNINIVHRDIKPDNVVIDKGYKLKLVNFILLI